MNNKERPDLVGPDGFIPIEFYDNNGNYNVVTIHGAKFIEENENFTLKFDYYIIDSNTELYAEQMGQIVGDYIVNKIETDLIKSKTDKIHYYGGID